MKKIPSLSIIVPVYNVEGYLKRCLKSIQDSQYTDFEVILVDDGSTDSSGGICDTFSKLDHRFHVLHIENGGVSHARNVGIDEARANYIIFIDSDDYIEPAYISNIIIQADEDFAYAGYKACFENRVLRVITEKNRIIELKDLKENVKRQGRQAIPYVVWRGCYRADIIKKNNLRFLENVSLGEDILFNLNYFEYCNKIRTSDNVGYCHTQVKTSLVHRYYPEMTEKEENEIDFLEKFSGEKNMRWRYYGWHVVIKHYKEWMKKADLSIVKDARCRLKKSYKSQYFREAIPYIRKYGTIDEKLETYLMGYYRHMIFELIFDKVLVRHK